MSVIEKSIFQAFGLCEFIFFIEFHHFIVVFIVKILKKLMVLKIKCLFRKK